MSENKSQQIAKAFHEHYEQLAPTFGYETRKESAKPWEDVPAQNKLLMMAVVNELIAKDIIRYGDLDA